MCVACLGSIAGTQLYISACDAYINQDTPEICELYLNQNQLVHQRFGQLRSAHFRKQSSVAFFDDRNHGGTAGIYVFGLVGSKANGVIQMMWLREAGQNGAISVPNIQINEEIPAKTKAQDLDRQPDTPPLQFRYTGAIG